MQHAIGDHALLADSRTAALLDPGGGVAWCCWPRFDSEPLFRGIIDDRSGGVFALRPAGEAGVASRAYLTGSLVLRTVWRCAGSARLVVDEALRIGGEPALLREVRAEGDAVAVEVALRPAGGDRVQVDGATALLARGGAERGVAVSAPGSWSRDGDTARVRFLASGAPSLVTMTGAGMAPASAHAGDGVAATLRRWRQLTAGVSDVPLRPDAVRLLGEARCRALLDVSAAVLIGLTHEAGGIVAAPTTSLPQWPGSERCWDYRFCWLRDAALAAQAMLRLGLAGAARDLGAFIARVIGRRGVAPMARVDGTPAPDERVRDDMSGYRGAGPVRFGNAAAAQLQVDVAGEVLELALMLAAADALPDSLAGVVPALAGWIIVHRDEPDHGIWEIRGDTRPYTHSQVMAWVGLDRAAALAARGRVRGDAELWRATAAAIRAHVLAGPAQPLQLRRDGGGADAALSVIAENGFVAPADPVCAATLDLIAARLDRGGVLDRYEGRHDLLTDPCAPFVFPTLWMATAAGATGRDAGRWLRAAVRTCGALGLLGEVVDPDTGGPLGNYPQVQSHAALVCALTPLAAPLSSRS